MDFRLHYGRCKYFACFELCTDASAIELLIFLNALENNEHVNPRRKTEASMILLP